MDADIFRRLVIRPVLNELGLWSEAAENLLLGTALHESGGLRHVRQIGGGPALGLYQMEPDTHADLWNNWLSYRPTWADAVQAFAIEGMPRVDSLLYMPAYATAAARLQYYRKPPALPDAHDIPSLAHYWKTHWNTDRGKGTVDQFIDAWSRYVG